MAAQYPGLHDLVQERLFPLVQQVVGFLGIEMPPEQEMAGQRGHARSSTSVASQPCTAEETRAKSLTSLSIQKEDTGGEVVAAGAAASSSSSGGGHRGTSMSEDAGAALLPYPGEADPGFEGAEGGGGGGDEKLGSIQFSISYDPSELILTLKVIRAVELVAKDMSGTSDPYVKIMLLPDKKRKLTTKIKRKNLNPRWNESFAFEGFPYNKLVSRTLYLQVIDYDRFSRDDPIGEVCLPLGDLDLSKVQTLWRTLQPCKGHAGKLGELLLSLNYQANVGVISVGVIQARYLKAKDINGLSDPYVKIWMMHDGKKVDKKKTEIKEKNLNPVFNETLMFTVPYERIRQTSLVVSVMDYDRMGRNEPIGQIVLGNKSGPTEVKHWNEMFAKSKTDVVKWHILKDFS